ncbi:AzlC family ABC transporter permease [Oscillibacter ruminantium]|uniref:AzlC family ABC transporter permease n=1 Tax=Oscillibacter ruminantium TaxID=1263547 RepID=UPI0002E88253|nr:AzlC family ABC transporter permease [Oscillibacter ruminantium]MDN0033103.1 AzlC family ABC transporter permease [Oscillibacter valericigenes]
MKPAFRDGMRDGIPIGLGYFAVSFSLGIAARAAGLTVFQGFLASLLNNSSSGEYAAFTLIANHATYLELALMTITANSRYFMMSCALSQKCAPGLPLRHRLLLGFDITDELFGITLARPGSLDPYYTYGAVATAAPCWAIGTAVGVVTGTLMPLRLVSAFSVALYGMFIAVVIPAAKQNQVVAGVVTASFVASFLADKLVPLATVSAGARIILLTLAVSAVAAMLFPCTQEEELQYA